MAASILALAAVETPDAQAKQQCSAAIPSSNKHGYWSYRLIDGRKCWYEGKPGLSKDLLEWPREANTREAKQEARPEPKEASRPEAKPEPRSQPRQALNSEARAEPRPTPRQEPKSEPRPEVGQEARQEASETLREEDAFAPPAMRTKPERVAAEKLRNPLDAQAWAPESDTFESRWHDRIQNQNLR
jgi:hypothetical protein